MAQHDYVIDNQSFPATRTDLNNVLQAIVSNNSGTSAPSTTFANQIWYDSNANILYIRNEDNDANIPLMQFDQSADVAATLATVIDILDASGTDQLEPRSLLGVARELGRVLEVQSYYRLLMVRVRQALVLMPTQPV